MKTAKEMFKELGYEQEIWCFEDENKIHEITYVRKNRFASNITFKVNNKCFKIHRKNELMAGYCDMPILKAINQQVKELGWDEN